MQKSRAGYKIVKFETGKEHEIPEDWLIQSIEDLGEVITGTTPSTYDKQNYGGDFPWATPPDLGLKKYVVDTQSKLSEKGFKLTRPIPAGSIMVTCIGIIGRIGIAAKQMATNQQINSIICKKHVPEFVYYQLLFNQQKIGNMANRAVVPILNKRDFGSIKIILPGNPEEQERIASILSKVDELIQKTDEIIEQTQRLKKGLMRQLLTRGIGHTKIKKVDMGLRYIVEEFPESWKIMTLQEVARIERGKFAHRPRGDPHFYGGNYPFIQTGDIENSDVYIRTFSQTLNDKGLSVSKMFPSGIIAITIVGANTGASAITTFPVCFPDSIIGIATTKMNIRFLHYYLQTRKRYLQMLATSSARMNLNLEALRPLRVPVPPDEEQNKIVLILSTISSKIEAEKRYRLDLGRLKDGLMQKLLTGEIRVKV